MTEIQQHINRRARTVSQISGVDEDDVRQIASITAWKAGKHEGVGIGYIIKAIEHKWVDLIRAAARDGFTSCESLDALLETGKEPSDGGAYVESTEFAIDCEKISEALWRHMPELAVVFDLIHKQGFSGKDIERYLGLSRRQVGSRIRQLQTFVKDLN